MKKVCIIGNLNVDLVMGPLNQPPEWEKEKVVRYFQVRTSGQVGYLAKALARLGVKVDIIANVGEDFYGEFILNDLQRFNINTKGIKILENKKTGVTIALVNPKGERALISYLGSMKYFRSEDIKEKWDLIQKSDYIIFNGYFLLPHLTFDAAKNFLTQIKQEGKMVVLDTGWDPSDWPFYHIKEIRELLRYTDIFLPNLAEAKIISQEEEIKNLLNTICKLGPQVVAVKMGSKGSIAIKEGKIFKQPSFKVKAVDTTGAGDTFNAGFIYGIIKGWEIDISLRFANALASLYISDMQDRYPHPEKIWQFVEQNRC